MQAVRTCRPVLLGVVVCASAGLCVAITRGWWPGIIGVPLLGLLTAIAVRGETSSVVSAFAFVLVLLTCMPVSVWFHGTPIGLYASLGRYALTGIMALWGTFILLRYRLRYLKLFDFAWISLAVCVAVSVAYSVAPSVSIGRGIPLVAFFLCLVTINEALDRDAVCAFRLTNSLIAATLCFLIPGSILAFTEPDLVFAAGRYTSSFKSASAVAGVCCVLLPLAMWGMRHNPGRVARVLCKLGTLVMLASLALSQARNAIAAFLAGMITIYIYKRKRSVIAIWPAVIVVLTVCARQVYSYSHAFTETKFFDAYLDRQGSFETGSGRFELWEQALQRVRNRPLTGYGYGTAQVALWSANLPRYLRLETRELAPYGDVLPFLRLNVPEGLNVHNSLLGVLLELGPVGFAACYVMLWCPFRISAALEPDNLALPHRSLAPYLVGALTAGFINSMFESWLLYPGGASFLLFWTIVAVQNSVTTHVQTDGAVSQSGPGWRSFPLLRARG
jgi:O-antigen ligase